MHRTALFLLALLGTLGVTAGLARLPRALGRVEAFQVREVRLEGARFLTYEETLKSASLPAGLTVWDDFGAVEERLERHPMVLRASVGRRFPNTLVLEVEERVPVALVPTPGLVPVDASGRALPVDPAIHRLDLPLIHPRRRTFRDENRLLPAELRLVARELGRLATAEPQFTARISDVRWTDGALSARLAEPPVRILFRPPLVSKRLREGMLALSDARGRWPERDPESLDLRFADQVVVGYPPRNRRTDR